MTSNRKATFGDIIETAATRITLADTVCRRTGAAYLLRESAAGTWMHGRTRYMVYRGKQCGMRFIVSRVLTINNLDHHDARFTQGYGLHFTSTTVSLLGGDNLQTRQAQPRYNNVGK